MKIRHVLAVTAVGLILATTTAAHAAGPPYTVSVGGSSAAGTHSYTAASTGAVPMNVKNNAGTVVTMKCTSVTGAGSVNSDTGVNPVASIASTTSSGCRFSGGAAAITQVGSWNVSGTGTNATSGNETVAGQIGNVTATHVTAANPNICRFTFSGAMNASFNGTAQQLVIIETGYIGNLKLSGVSGCLGQLQNGNPMNLGATLNITLPDGLINLS